MVIYLFFIYKKPIILSLFKIDTLKFTMYILTGSRTVAPEENCRPLSTPKTNPKPNPSPNRGQSSSGAIAWLPPNPKTNLDLDPNPNPNRGQFSSGGNCPDTILTILTYPLKTYVIRLHNLISMNIFFIVKDHNFSL